MDGSQGELVLNTFGQLSVELHQFRVVPLPVCDMEQDAGLQGDLGAFHRGFFCVFVDAHVVIAGSGVEVVEGVRVGAGEQHVVNVQRFLVVAVVEVAVGKPLLYIGV